MVFAPIDNILMMKVVYFLSLFCVCVFAKTEEECVTQCRDVKDPANCYVDCMKTASAPLMVQPENPSSFGMPAFIPALISRYVLSITKYSR